VRGQQALTADAALAAASCGLYTNCPASKALRRRNTLPQQRQVVQARNAGLLWLQGTELNGSLYQHEMTAVCHASGHLASAVQRPGMLAAAAAYKRQPSKLALCAMV
jgi:hypothetical protein